MTKNPILKSHLRLASLLPFLGKPCRLAGLMLTATLGGLALPAAAQNIQDYGTNAPTPGASDIAQLVNGNGGPSGLNYYVDSGNPGQTFTTGSNPQGYSLQNLYLKEQSGTAGGGQPGLSAYTLRIYSVAGTAATLLSTYVTTNQITFTQGDWLKFNGLTNLLASGSVYGFAISRNGSGWWQLADSSANPYAGGQAAAFPKTTGTLNFGSSTNYDAAFDLVLLPYNDPLVTPTAISPANPVYAGTTVTLSANVSGTGPFTNFMWQTDGGSGGATWSNLAGSTSATYTLDTTLLAAGNLQYRLIVAGAAGTTTNTPSTLVLSNAAAPFLLANTTIVPAPAALGGTITASASFAGTLPIYYQWQFTGTNGVTRLLPGATSSALTLTNLQYTNAGTYSLVASNNAGGVPSVLASTPATLTVLAPVIFTDLGATAPVPGIYDIAQLSTAGNTGAPDAPVNNYYDDNGTPQGQTFTTGANSSGYVLNSVCIKYGTVNGGHGAGLTYTLRFYALSGTNATLLSTYQNNNTAPAIALGDWTQWSVGLTNVLSPNSVYAYTLHASSGYEQIGCASGDPYAGGQIVAIPAAGGLVTTGTAGTFDGTFLVNLVPLGFPVIKTASITPANSVTNPVYGGTPVTLNVNAIGSTPLNYIWQTDNGTGGATWSNLPNANTNNLVLDTTSMAAGTYEYQVLVTNNLSSATSAILTLNLLAASGPVLSADTKITPPATSFGNPVVLSTTFAGTPPIAYQWYFNSGSGATRIAGANNSTYTLASAQVTNSGTYFVTASNVIGGSLIVTSTPANLLVTAPGVTNLISAAIVDVGTTTPTPGTYDISQLVAATPSIVPVLNYYVNNNAPPGQTFLTGTNPPTAAGYPLTSIALQTEPNTVGSGGGIAQVYTLNIYVVSATNAALLTSYVSTNTLTIVQGDWVQWTGLTNVLRPNTTYAFSINNDYNIYGWWKVANDGSQANDLYTNGQSALLPASGYGAMAYSSDATIDAAFVVGLTPLSSPVVVADTTIYPAAAYAGNLVTLQSLFSGTSPIKYQWQFTPTNGTGTVNIPGATNVTYTIQNMSAATAGTYSLLASNNPGGIPATNASTPTLLSLLPAPTNFVANFAYSVRGPTTYAGPGVFPSAQYWNTIANYSGGTPNALADDGLTDLYISFTSSRTWDYGNYASGAIGLFGNYELNQGSTPQPFGLNNLPAGVYNLYLYSCDGGYEKSQTIFTINGQSITNLNTTDLIFLETNNYCVFTNIIVTNGVLNGTWAEGNYEGSLNGLQVQLAYSFANPAIYIASQPANTTVALGQPASLSIMAYGPPTLHYQWRANGVPMAGATNSTLTFASATVANSLPTYDVVVTNTTGLNATSTTANLTVRTSVNDLVWQPYYNNVWDLATGNWEDTNSLAGGIVFQQGDNILFDDSGADFTVAFNQRLMPGSVTFNATTAYDLQGFGSLSFTMNLILQGTGAVTLETVNDYTGNTVLSPGTTLALAGSGAIAASSQVYLGAGATLSATGRADKTFTVTPVQTLAGDGVYYVNGTLANQGTLAFKVKKASGVITNDQIQGLTRMAYGGQLQLALSGQALAVGDAFQLITATNYTGAFTTIAPAAPGTGLAWNTSALATTGVLSVVNSVNTSPTKLTSVVAGNVLTLSWPADHTGWRLQSQTNAPGQGLGTNWVTVSGSTSTNSAAMNVNPASGSVFFRLVYP